MNRFFGIFLTMSLLCAACEKTTNPDGTTDPSTDTSTPPISSGDGTTPTAPQPTPVPTPTPAPVTEADVPREALTFGTNIDLLNFNNTQATKYNKAIAIVKMVVATEEFRNRVLNHTYNGTKQFANNKGRTNAQIYQSILEAAETLRPAKNNTMDLEVELYYANNSVVGYTNGGTTQIWVNTKFFNQYAENSVSSNLFHEWLHKLGYGHDYSATAQRPYSVPYAVGYIIRDIGKKFL